MTSDPSTEPMITDSSPPSAPPATASVDAAASLLLPPEPGRARRRGFLDYVLAAALVLAVGGVAFAAGRTTAPAAASGLDGLNGGGPGAGGFGPGASFDPGPGGPSQGGPGQGGAFGGIGGLTIAGTVTSIDGSSLVITTGDGQALTVTLDGATAYHEATSTDPSSVVAGDTVTVRVSGGGPGAAAGQGSSGALSLTASDVTVVR